MIKNVQELEKVITEKKNKLSDVYAQNLLNSEGVKTLEAYTNILKITPFYADLKELKENERLQEMLNKYSDCNQIKHLIQFLNKVQ